LHVIACIEDPAVIKKILVHLGQKVSFQAVARPLEAALHHRPVKETLHSNDRLQRLQRHGNFRPAGRNRPEMEVWHGQIQSQLTTFDENSQDIR
jgi:hypothetical protein